MLGKLSHSLASHRHSRDDDRETLLTLNQELLTLNCALKCAAGRRL